MTKKQKIIEYSFDDGPVEFEMRADKSGYIVFTCLWIPMIVLCIMLIHKELTIYQSDVHTFHANIRDALILMIAPLGFVYLWLSSFRLKVKNNTIWYKTLFSRTIKVDVLKVSCVPTNSDDYKRMENIKPPFRLELYIDKIINNKTMWINLKVLSAEDIRRLFAYLESKGVDVL
jgi:hypothetical protein